MVIKMKTLTMLLVVVALSVSVLYGEATIKVFGLGVWESECESEGGVLGIDIVLPDGSTSCVEPDDSMARGKHLATTEDAEKICRLVYRGRLISITAGSFVCASIPKISIMCWGCARA